ncbi:HNH endonuclease signature motif containing protein [Kitasatospora sp. NPDC048545]|uniref:HNH endonuclease signature motif containing protein n=1 Tax=Kitasatospora sp. NPDC048545 TaxID=3157208 RepID=UPI0033DEC510
MTLSTDRTCSISDCTGRTVGRGWCARHYGIWRTHGDPLHPVRRYVRQGSECVHPGCDLKPQRRNLCNKHAKREEAHGETTDPRERRFWAKVDKNGPTPENRPTLGPCWIWTGYIHAPSGYGQYGLRNGTRLVHRISYQYLVGPIPKGLHLDHLCRRRECCRPDHLEPVTPRENLRRGDQGAFWGYVPESIPMQPKPSKPERCTGCGDNGRAVYKRTLCRPCYRKWLKDPDVERPSQRTPEQRFWAKVEKTPSCWLWTASVHSKTGYGRFAVKHGQMVDAHRYSYFLAFGAIPDGLDVHHTCHVRHCIRPEHLRATTRSENLALRKVRRP